MITDLVIGIAHALFGGVVGVLPEMGEPPEFLWQAFVIFAYSNQLLPSVEVVQFFPVMVVSWGVVGLWRLVRLALPGG